MSRLSGRWKDAANTSKMERMKDYEKNQICFDDNIVGVSLRTG